LRPGDNADADSVVALNAQTGAKVWAFQLVHHDLWDYDTAAQPLLFMFHGKTPAVAVTNKTGMVYVLDRRTGAPLYPVEERRVPSSDVAGEKASSTQPFSSLQLNPITLAGKCGSALRYEGIFTPPSIRGTLEFPGKTGGVNWGSAAYDPESGMYYAATNRWAFEVRLVKRGWRSDLSWSSPFAGSVVGFVMSWPFTHKEALIVDLVLAALGLVGLMTWRPLIYCGVLSFFLVCLGALQYGILHVAWMELQDHLLHTVLGVDDSPMLKTPYALYLRPLKPACSMAPSAITAINLQTGQKVWESPLPTVELGGPIVTAAGLVFSAGTRDPYLRAFDKSNGKELWEGKLPVPAQATPMTYSIDGRQFVVIADGGHGLFETAQSDSLIAYALP
jgi:quinoprotein glucose dehydrogenase